MTRLLLGFLVSLWKLGIPQTWCAWLLRPHPLPIAQPADIGDRQQ